MQEDLSSALGELRAKLVFPECASDFRSSLLDAVSSPTTQPTLTGKAVVIGRLFAVEHTENHVRLTLTGMHDARITATKGLWKELCDSFDSPIEPKGQHLLESLMIAIINIENDQISLHEAAWSRMDEFGTLFESDYEALTARQLRELELKYFKPAYIKVRVGNFALRADFWIQPDTEKCALEVDPKDSAALKRNKRDRDDRYKMAGVKVYSYDPCVDDLQALLSLSRSPKYELGAVE